MVQRVIARAHHALRHPCAKDGPLQEMIAGIVDLRPREDIQIGADAQMNEEDLRPWETTRDYRIHFGHAPILPAIDRLG
ncbi:hypothetical protein [Sphingomonas crocodyli]|uniref:Uncharacterized protein n=1 Tax=Sphingomonas crocodyli TaxID=1979270 RepID=A0A437LXT9_9SPHN|nr:hypothetical protein [Sphingomonas crocodyli]RVT90229.1 hypothetical protein EOD43_18205 [Sphingomonas crocodyli]